MVSQQASTRAGSDFPHPTEAISFGWRFVKATPWVVLILVGLDIGVNSIAEPFLDRATDDGVSGSTIVVSLVIAFVFILLSSVFELGLWRRGFDYWDEAHGLAAPRTGSEALKHAVDTATPRVWPYFGWSTLWAVVLVGVSAIVLAIADAISDLGGAVLLLVFLVVLYSFLLLTAFFDIAVADGPGNPVSKSFRVFKGHFWRIVGTYLLCILAALALVVPFFLVYLLLGKSAENITAAIGGVSAAVFIRTVGSGAAVAMYRSVIGPDSAAG